MAEKNDMKLADTMRDLIQRVEEAENQNIELNARVVDLESKVKSLSAAKQKQRIAELETALREKDALVASLRAEIEHDRVANDAARTLQDRLTAIAERLGISQAGHSSQSLLSAIEHVIRRLRS